MSFFLYLLFQLAGSALFILRNVLDVVARTLSSHTHAKRVFAILIIPTVPFRISPPRLLTISLSAVAWLFGTAQFLAYAVPQVRALLGLLLKLADAWLALALVAKSLVAVMVHAIRSAVTLPFADVALARALLPLTLFHCSALRWLMTLPGTRDASVVVAETILWVILAVTILIGRALAVSDKRVAVDDTLQYFGWIWPISMMINMMIDDTLQQGWKKYHNDHQNLKVRLVKSYILYHNLFLGTTFPKLQTQLASAISWHCWMFW